MAYDFTEFNTRKDDVIEWLKKEFSAIRTGRATVTLLDSVVVDSYGAKTPLNQTANLTVEDPKTIRIVLWDKSLIPEVEKGIAAADLGVSTAADDEGVRAIFPDLTTENRERLVKLAKSKVEEAKVSLRNERSAVVKDIDTEQKNGNLSADDAKRDKDELQKLVDEAGKGLDEMVKAKETEIMS